MNRIIFITIIISALWIQAGFAVKCYVQGCSQKSWGYSCGYAGKAEKEGRIEEDSIGCYESREMRNGKLWEYTRMIIQREGYGSTEKEGLKKGCVTDKYNDYGDDVEKETCYCSKDLCNAKHKLPEGALFADEEQPEHINDT